MKTIFAILLSVLMVGACSTAVLTEAQEQGVEELNLEIVAAVAERGGWCDVPLPALTKGQTAIVWERDIQGRCLTNRIIKATD